MNPARFFGGLPSLAAVGLSALLAMSQATTAAELQLVGAAQPLLPGIVTRATSEEGATIHRGGALVVFACPDCEADSGTDLWLAQRHGDTWIGPGRAKPSSIASDESAPAFSADGSWLYFVSGRRGGAGGDDLYRVAYSSVRGRFSVPENLGPAVNSRGDEGGATTFEGDAGVIFASRGHKGARGWDLFLSPRVNGRLAAAKRLTSLNTAGDETAPALLPGDIGVLFVRDGQAWFAARRGDDYVAPQRLGEAINAPGSRVFSVQHAHDAPDQLVFARAGSDGRGDVLRIGYRIVPDPEGDRAADDR